MRGQKPTDVAVNDIRSGNWIHMGGCVEQIGCLRPRHFEVGAFFLNSAAAATTFRGSSLSNFV